VTIENRYSIILPTFTKPPKAKGYIAKQRNIVAIRKPPDFTKKQRSIEKVGGFEVLRTEA